MKLSEEFLAPYKVAKPPFGGNGFGAVVFYRTYSREKEDGSKEKWWETVRRCVEGAQAIGARYTMEEMEKLYDHVFYLRGSFSGRALWQLGTPLVEKFNGESLVNCFHGNTLVETRGGYLPIASLAGQEVEVRTFNNEWVSAKCKSYGESELLRVTVIAGHTEPSDHQSLTIDATPNHDWYLFGGVKKSTSELVEGDDLARPDFGISGWRVSKVEKADPAEVFCFEVPNTHSFTLYGNILTSNCWGASTESVDDFVFLMDMMMLGGGVGLTVERPRVHSLPKVKKGVEVKHELTKDADFIVPDSRTGWSQLLRKVLTSYFETGESFSYSTILVRPFGAPLKTFGGTASGPEILVEGIDEICKILDSRAGKKIRSIDATDIIDIIGMIVVAGSSRRSAILIGGDPDDHLFMQAKNWGKGLLPRWRDKSNNSIIVDSYDQIPDSLWKGYDGSGEPYGLINIALCRSMGRVGEPVNDEHVAITNPCLHGDTLVAVSDPRQFVSIRELETIGDDIYVKTYLNGKRVDRPARDFRITQENAPVCKVKFANGIEITCTYDHKFFTFDGLCINAKALTSNDRVAWFVKSNVDYHTPMKSGLVQYDAYCQNAGVHIKRDCETCGFPMLLRWANRTTAYCSADCYDNRKTNEIRTGTYAAVTSVEDCGVADVYNVTVDDSHVLLVTSDPKLGVVPTAQCGEIPLEVRSPHAAGSAGAGGEACNLSELFLPNIRSQEEMNEVARLLYKTQKAITSMNYSYPGTREIIRRNRRLGLGITGWMQASKEKLDWVDPCYRQLKEYDKLWSKELGVNTSIKISTSKPSGCRPIEELTVTDQGILTLEEILSEHPDNTDWHSLKNDIHSIHPNDEKYRITKSYVNGESETVLINTTSGFELRSTPNHQWFVTEDWSSQQNGGSTPVNKWVEAKDLKPNYVLKMEQGLYRNDKPYKLLPIPTRTLGSQVQVLPKLPTEMTDNLAWVLGYLWGDGAFSIGNYRIRFIDQYLNHIERVQSVIWEEFGITSKITKASGGRNAYCLDYASKHLWLWLIHNGIWKYSEKDGIGCIPRCIRGSSRNHILSFLAGLVDSDGCVYNDKNINTYARISISTSDDDFSRHLQTVAWSVGIGISRSLQSKGESLQEERHLWHMIISPQFSDLDSLKYVIKASQKCQNKLTNNQEIFFFKEKYQQCCKPPGVVKCVKSGPVVATFDIEVEKAHSYYNGPFLSHNTLSSLAFVTPGIHPAFSKYFIRRIRVVSTDPLVDTCKEHGYPVEYDLQMDGSRNHRMVVISFPCTYGEDVITADQLTAIDQLEWVKFAQRDWADNSVSCTVYYKLEELESIKQWLKENFDDNIKSVSFLLHKDHGFALAPFEEITKEQYLKMCKTIKPIEVIEEGEGAIDVECEGGTCPVR